MYARVSAKNEFQNAAFPCQRGALYDLASGFLEFKMSNKRSKVLINVDLVLAPLNCGSFSFRSQKSKASAIEALDQLYTAYHTFIFLLFPLDVDFRKFVSEPQPFFTLKCLQCHFITPFHMLPFNVKEVVKALWREVHRAK